MIARSEERARAEPRGRQGEASRACERRSAAGRDGRARDMLSATVSGGHMGRRASLDGRDEARERRRERTTKVEANTNSQHLSLNRPSPQIPHYSKSLMRL